MGKTPTKRNHSFKKLIIVILPLFLVLVVLLSIALISDSEKIVAFKDYGYAFVNTNRLVNIMRVPGGEADLSDLICVLSSDGEAKIKEGSVKYNGESLSEQLPLFFDNNSYIYIPWEKAVFLDNRLRLRSIDGYAFFIKDAFFGDDYTRRESGKDLLLLSCTRNLFLALEEFSVTTIGETFTISPKELVLFDGYSIKTTEVFETNAKRSSHGIAKDSLVTVNGHTYVMSDFLSSLGLTVERDSTSGGLEKIEIDSIEKDKTGPNPIEDTFSIIPEATYQYFLANRYNLPEGLEVYQVGTEWYQKRNDLAIQLQTAPLYGEKYIYLPADYGIADPVENTQCSLPAFSRIDRKKGENGECYAVTSDEAIRKEIPRSVLYDGIENYFFTDEVNVLWKNQSYKLAPFSCVTYDGVNRLDFYDVGEDKSYSYITDAGSVKVLFDDGFGVDVVSKTIITESGDGMIVSSKPGMYASLFD